MTPQFHSMMFLNGGFGKKEQIGVIQYGEKDKEIRIGGQKNQTVLRLTNKNKKTRSLKSKSL